MAKKSNTRAAQGSGTIRQRPDGRWEARYTIGRNPGTGKQARRSIYGDSQQEVLKKLRQVQAAIDAGTYTEPSKMTVAQWVDAWQADYLGSVKRSTLFTYERYIENYVKPYIGAVQLQRLRAHDIQSFYNRLQREKELSAKTIKNLNGVLHSALKQAVLNGYLNSNPTESCVLPRVERAEIKPLCKKNIESFLGAIQGHQFEAIYFIDLFTGMRQGEILGLTWDCVDFAGGTININKQLVKDKFTSEYSLAPLKNDKPRRIIPAAIVMQKLKEVRTQQSKWKLAAGAAFSNPKKLVFTNETGRHLIHFTVYKHFKRIMSGLGLDATRFHDLRHSYAVSALQAGDDIKTVQETLGHHTAAFTLDVYGHVTEEMQRASAERMNRFIEGIKTPS